MDTRGESSGAFHYAWVIAGLTFLVLLATAGVRSAPGVLIVPLEREFGWDRATISLAVSVNLVLYGLIGPFAAAFMGRLGIRRTVLASLLFVATGVALTPLMTAPWHLMLLWGVVVGGGTGMTALVLGATVVNRWFAERRGLVLGVLTASTATGQLVFLPMLASVVARVGWRPAALVVAGVAAAVAIPVALLFRERPSDLGLMPYGASPATESLAVAVGNPFVAAIDALRDGLRSRDFWLLAGSFFVCGASTNGLIGTHLIPACLDYGIPEVQGASLLAAMGLFDLAGTTASGWLSDRWDNRVLLCWYYGLRGVALVFLPSFLGSAAWGLPIFALIYGLDWIATVPPTVKLTSDAFGKARAPVMFGWIVAAHQLGAAAAALGAGAVRTWMGDYERAFLTSGALCLITAGFVLRIGRDSPPESEPVPGDVQLEPSLG
ncbi:Oxalate:formate antiporter [Aquisphaera giovannonii]|uniref:Oxalate:formate antiporter n=1 Tax=Aquisphaera giovannonii TaxID=406548 RepID=A0A5B9W989_9BACT|nr:MFS transporter [Aquisphaera giovannonii]QEH36631.1 Oxalate:formate antiporter [Aquisphaera giovannonii]